MAQASLSPTFDYSSLDGETSRFIQQQTGEIRMLMRRTAQDIFEIGQKLIDVKQKLGHGQFLAWLQAEFAWKERTARNFMYVAKQFKSATIADLELAPSVLYMLAAPSTPEAAREEAIARAEAGESISKETAQKIKQKYQKTSKPPSSEPSGKSELETEVKSQSRQRVTARDTDTSKLPKPEILAIRPKEKVEDLPVSSTVTATATTLPPSQTPLIQPVATGIWWQLGEKHLLYCGSPLSPRFQERLPSPVAISLAFPPRKDDWIESLNPKIYSALCFYSVYEDLDLKLVRELVERSLLLCTESDEVVVFNFLWDPQLILLADSLGCRCMIAEPDTKRCEAAISTWKQAGRKVEKLERLRF